MRAQRRHHNERVKARFDRKQRLRRLWGDGDKSAGIFANHGKTCSCVMCGNPRRYFGEKTIQERKQDQYIPEYP